MSQTAERPSTAAALAGVTASISVFAVAQGLSYPLFTFLMQRQGLPAWEIGLSAAATPVGLILSAPLVPLAVRYFGAQRLAVGCALIAAILFVLVGLTQNWFAWLALRFLLGFAVNPLYILGEVWMLALATPERRGRVMGVFTAITGAGYALGPLSLTLVGSEGWPPLLICVFGFIGCAALLGVTARGLAGFEEEVDGAPRSGLWSFWLVAPALMLAVVVSAATQQSGYSLLPVFGASYGLPEDTLAALLTAMSLGNIVLQVPLGVMAERFGARSMIVACAAANAVCAILVALTIETALIWPVVMVMGAVGYGVYTMALVELGDRFSGSALVAGNAAFAMMWGVGGIVGPAGVGRRDGNDRPGRAADGHSHLEPDPGGLCAVPRNGQAANGSGLKRLPLRPHLRRDYIVFRDPNAVLRKDQMAKVVVREQVSRSTGRGDVKTSVGRKMIRDTAGKLTTLRILDAGSKTFSDDLTYVFSKNVTTARQENRRIIGAPDFDPTSK